MSALTADEPITVEWMDADAARWTERGEDFATAGFAQAAEDCRKLARALRNLAAGIRECEATFAAYERHSGHYEDGKFDACDRINDILTGQKP